jgi:hypothetical protein
MLVAPPPQLCLSRIPSATPWLLCQIRSSVPATPRHRVFTSFARPQHSKRRRSPLERSCYIFFAPSESLRVPAFKLADLQQTRYHSGHHHHGHGHHHHHDTSFLTSRDKTDPGVRITRVGLYVNIAMVLTKGIGGWVFNSQALVGRHTPCWFYLKRDGG